MTKEQEAQQAQTIAECRQWHEATEAKGDMQLKSTVVHAQRGALLKIVDSQAQKIAEREKEIEILREAVKYDKYANIARIMKRRKDVSVFTHKKAEALQKLHEFDESARLLK